MFLQNTMLCKRPFYRSITFILYFVSLPLTSPSFCNFLDYSTHFHSLPFTSYFGLSYLRMFLTILVFVMFYLHTISDSRMFVVTILTWSIRNTGSVFWSLLVRCVANIDKNKYVAKAIYIMVFYLLLVSNKNNYQLIDCIRFFKPR